MVRGSTEDPVEDLKEDDEESVMVGSSAEDSEEDSNKDGSIEDYEDDSTENGYGIATDCVSNRDEEMMRRLWGFHYQRICERRSGLKM